MSPTSVCYTVTKTESGTDNMGGRGTSTRARLASADMKGASGIQFGIRKQEKVSVSPMLKVSKDSHRIRKPPLPLPQVQYRPPIIIHTYSPKVIHTQPDDFMLLVQKLTGSSDTRLRLKRKPSSTKSSAPPSGGSDDASDIVDVVADLEQQGSKTSAQCGSPSSSEEDSSFMANSEVCVAGDLATNPKQSHSPRSPLSNFEFDNQDFPFIPFDPSSALFSHVKAEPSFAFNDNPFNFYTDFNSQPTKPGSMNQPAPKAQMLQPQEYSPFHSIDINSALPSSGYLSSGFMTGLPDLSPASASWSQSFLDCLSGTPSSFTNQPPIQRQRFSGGYTTPSSEGTMVALENIQAFMLT